jgi:hypothetical protein
MKRRSMRISTEGLQKKRKSAAENGDPFELFKVASYPQLLSELSSGDLENMISDCQTCFTCREVADGDNYSTGSTFFVSAMDKPRCGLEDIALKIFSLHAKDMEFDPATSGAEWWTQYIDHRDDIGFHWDRDYGLEEDKLHVHPALGTVTYLCVNSGPTVIFDKKGIFAYGKDISGPLNRCVVSRPMSGKHITFNGELLHGAPSDLARPLIRDDNEGLRVTFLVNIWINHKPIQSEKINGKIAKSLKLTVSSTRHLNLNITDRVSAMRPDNSLPPVSEKTTYQWQINSSGVDYIIHATFPAASDEKQNVSLECFNLTDSYIYEGELSSESEDTEEDGTSSSSSERDS